MGDGRWEVFMDLSDWLAVLDMATLYSCVVLHIP